MPLPFGKIFRQSSDRKFSATIRGHFMDWIDGVLEWRSKGREK
jgi:hypothetical protein